MNENVDNLVLEHLRIIRSDIAGIKDDTREIKQRLTSLETSGVRARADNLGTQDDVYRQQAAIDRLSERLDRVERRLDLREEA